MLRLIVASLLLFQLSSVSALAQLPTSNLPSASSPSEKSAPGQRTVIAEVAHDYCQQLAVGLNHGAALASVCEFSMSIRSTLPDYICTQTMVPIEAPHYQVGAPQLKITAEVGLQGGSESYSDIRVNGKPANLDLARLPFGSIGEFGSLLRAIFHPQNAAQFSFVKEVRLHSKPALLFEFTVHQDSNKSLWFLHSAGRTYYPGYRGNIWLEETSFHILRLEMKAVEMEQAKIPFSQFKLVSDYAETPLGDGTSFVLPVESSTYGCNKAMVCMGSSVTFSNCHKFAAKSRILPTP
jgi:hypothetical protein